MQLRTILEKSTICLWKLFNLVAEVASICNEALLTEYLYISLKKKVTKMECHVLNWAVS